MTAANALAFVEAHEEDEAKRLIDAEFVKLTGKKFTPKPLSYFVDLKIHTRSTDLRKVKMPDGSEKTIFAPIQYLQDDKYQSVAALVCAIGPLAFHNRETGEPYVGAPWFRVGDWLHVARASGASWSFHGIPMVTIPDDCAYQVIEDPTDVQVINVADKV